MVKLVLAVLAAGVSAAAPFKEANEVRSLIRSANLRVAECYLHHGNCMHQHSCRATLP